VIGVHVGECGLGRARARHALAELALMAGLPRAEGPPAVTLAHGRGEYPPGPKVVIPCEAEHVARETPPDVWRDGDAEVPILFRSAAPEGEVLARAEGGAPLVVRNGEEVYLTFDAVAATDYYLNGRGEVGWPRDRCGRPDLGGAPPWRRESVGVAAVNRYARLLGRAVEAACEAAAVPLVRFRYWPDGAPFAAALSHDVDRLRAPSRREVLRSWLRPSASGARARYRLRDFVRGSIALEPLPAIWRAEEPAGSASTFFVGAVRRGPTDYTYELADAAGLLAELAAAGREVGLHGSHYSCDDGAALREEKERLEAAAGGEVAGVRGHYLRLGPEGGWPAVAAAGFAYDATFGLANEVGFRAGAALPYRPFDVDRDKPYDFVEIPPAAMDGALFQYKRFGPRRALAATLRLADEAAATGGLCPLIWHYRAFRGGVFPEWGGVFEGAVARVVAAGGLAMTHRDAAARYRLNAALTARGPGANGAVEILLPAGAPGDVVFEVSTGWKVAAGDARVLSPRVFKIEAGVREAGVTFAREG
jgi:peptidoglycan/xylan/chitin deacetylase (PgdA/CDA1 family)